MVRQMTKLGEGSFIGLSWRALFEHHIEGL